MSTIATDGKGSINVFLSFDIEGVCGVSTDLQCDSTGRDFEQFRRFAMAEVNAAVEGAVAGGAGKVLVADGHGDGQNLLIQELHPAAEMLQAWPRPLMMMEGVQPQYAACVFIGYHAKEGTEGAILAHTMSDTFFNLKINNEVMGELQINALIANACGSKVVFVSGDNAICAEAKALDASIITVETKRAIGYYAAHMRRPAVVLEEIRSGVQSAINSFTPPQARLVPQPVEVELTYRKVLSAEIAACLLGMERADGRTVRFRAPDILAAMRHIGALQLMNRLS